MDSEGVPGSTGNKEKNLVRRRREEAEREAGRAYIPEPVLRILQGLRVLYIYMY